MIALAPGWLLYRDVWVMRYIVDGDSGYWLDAALLDRCTGATYPLRPGFTAATIARVPDAAAVAGAGDGANDGRRA